ncbi:hypothetical protein LCGC14_2390060, partial [marine sediment metagenome]
MHKPVKARNNARPRSSYYGSTPEARERQMANLAEGRRGKIAGQRPAPPQARAAQLQKMDIVGFATGVLHLSFEERPAQEVVLRALYGLPLSPEQLEIYTKLTTNKEEFEPGTEKTEAVFAVGARGGKSTLASVIALYESICRGHIWRKYLQPGETGYCILTATRETQSIQIIQRNAARLLRDSDISYYIDDEQSKELILVNGLRILSVPCNSTAARGLPIFCLIFDEIAHYRLEGVKADKAIYVALSPRQS